MKWIIATCSLFVYPSVPAQVDLRVEYNFTGRIPISNKKYSNALNIEAAYKRILLSTAYGREYWYYNDNASFGNGSDSVRYPKSKADKLEFFCGYKAPIIQKTLEISFLYGIRTYFRNEVEKNLSFYDNGNKPSFTDGLVLSSLNREHILHTNPSYGLNNTYRYISKMRFAHLLKINLSYTYKNVGFNVFYIPNLIHFKYETPLEPKKYGSNYLLFHDVGIGVSYNFRFKPKQQE